jgi:hypothetical protein
MPVFALRVATASAYATADVECPTVGHTRLANALCRFVERAGALDKADSRA